MTVIVTDSTAYLTKEEAKAWGVHVVPMSYTVEGRLYTENYSGQNGRFEELIFGGGRCTTAQGSVSAYMSVFEELTRQNHDVLCIVISSRLSGTYSSASIAAKTVNPEKIAVVDSLTTAGGLYFLVKTAVELAQKGLPLNELALEIQRLRDNIGIAFSVDKMDALRRSGRLGIVRQSVATILNIRPILMCVDGAVVADGIARGQSELFERLAGAIPKNAKEIIVHYIQEKTNLRGLISKIESRFSNVSVMLRRLGPVLGIHLGLGVVGVSWMTD